MKGVRGEWVLMRVFIGEGDRLHGRALYERLVEEARRQGLAGATVLRGIMGFGANSVMHTTRLLRMSEDLPIVVEIVDAQERIDAFLATAEAMIDETGCGALITVEKAHIIRYTHDARHRG